MMEPSTSTVFEFGVNRVSDIASRPPRGWLLYDGACGVCSRWVPFWAPALRGIGLDVAPLQTPWVAERLGLAPDQLVNDIRIVFAEGGNLAGPAVYRYAMKRIWWSYPLYLVTLLPGLREGFDRAYRGFADHRMHFSKACRIDPPPRP